MKFIKGRPLCAMKEASGKDLFPGFMIDGGRPTGNGLQEQLPNCPKLHV